MKTDYDALIVILGLSDDPQRYAYKAAKMLQEKGFKNLIGIHPQGRNVLGIPVMKSITEVSKEIHTLTLYVGPAKSAKIGDDILLTKPKRIIFNPGTENPSFAQKAQGAGIETLEACNLVLLSSHHF